MNKMSFSILSLLSRESLSGYDLKKQMNDRISQFLKVSNNQIYPQLTKLEEQGFIRLMEVTENVQHAEKKIYEITSLGLDELKNASLQDFGDATVKDGFLATIYNSWLLDDGELTAKIIQERQNHEERIAMFEHKITDLAAGPHDKQYRASLAVLEYGKRYDKMYRDWCTELLTTLV